VTVEGDCGLSGLDEKAEAIVEALSREEVVRRFAGKVHETLQPSAATSGLSPIIASEAYQSKAWGREVDERCARLASYKETGEFREAWIVANHHQSFYGSRDSLQNIAEGFKIAVIKQFLDFAGWLLQKLTPHSIQRVARTQGC
jgi:hypothetical protein